MLKVGFVGWRGMVGSVLMDRMDAEIVLEKVPEFNTLKSENRKSKHD